MSQGNGNRYWILGGVAYPILGWLGDTVSGSKPDFVAKPTDVAAYFQAHTNAALAGHMLFLLSGIVLLAFAGAMRTVLQQAEGGESRISAIAYAGGVAGATLSMAAAAAVSVAALRVNHLGAIDAPVAAVLYDLGLVLYGTAAAAAFGVFALGIAIVALRSGVLPRWLGAITVPLGVALLVPPISYAVTTPFALWVGVTCVVMAVRAPAAEPLGAASFAAG